MFNYKITSTLQALSLLGYSFYWLEALKRIYELTDSEAGYIINLINNQEVIK